MSDFLTEAVLLPDHCPTKKRAYKIDRAGGCYQRVENGWTQEDALLTPRGGRRGRAHG